MKPWTIDADDIQIESDFDKNLLLQTAGLEDFLQNNERRFIVIGTKGIGKTLLLKVKRLKLQSENDFRCLPERLLIDKPVGDKIFSSKLASQFDNSPENWRKLWIISIVASVLKAESDIDDEIKVCSSLHSLLSNNRIKTVMDHFSHVLEFKNQFHRATEDTERWLIPRFREVNRDLAIFLDSIDEYFNKHLTADPSSVSGELSAGIWYYSQMGLFEAIYQLRRLNHRVKVFASVRKEAFVRFRETPMWQQYRGSVTDPVYSVQELKEIFEKNIASEVSKNLVNKSALKEDSIRAFVGFDKVVHQRTGIELEFFDYVYRHTFGRPRDLMTVGRHISALRPSNRSEFNVMSAVNEAAGEIADEYLAEIAPMIADVDIDCLFTILDTNVMSSESIENYLELYWEKTNNLTEEIRNPFAVLFRAGLIGNVELDNLKGGVWQRFLKPGQRGLDGIYDLPESDWYLIHPALTEKIKTLNPKYASNICELNVIGDGLAWQSKPQEFCVLKGDIKGYSKLMESGLGTDVTKYLDDAINRNAKNCRMKKLEGGDSLTIIHRDAEELISISRRIMEDVFRAPGSPILRMAIDCGAIEFAAGSVEPNGMPLRTAARLEACVDPGDRGSIWVTEAVHDKLFNQEKSTFFQLESVNSMGINIKKPGSDDDEEIIQAFYVV